jgi:hypothetical protein
LWEFQEAEFSGQDSPVTNGIVPVFLEAAVTEMMEMEMEVARAPTYLLL